jgi:hypothetical protein
MEAILTWIVLLAAAVGAVGLLWNKTIRPVAKFIAEWPDAYKVLLEISDEFKPNDGHSLVDRIETLEQGQQTLEQGQQDISTWMGNITRQLETHLVDLPRAAERSSDD